MFICIAFAFWNICETYMKTVVSYTVPHPKRLRTYTDYNIPTVKQHPVAFILSTLKIASFTSALFVAQ